MSFPINLVLRGHRVVVIGGGTVATRKVARLLNSSAKVVVISPEVSDVLIAMESAGKLKIQRKKYESGDLEGASLVFAASDDEGVNFQVAEEGHQLGALVNVVSDPEAGDFTLPAIAEIGGVRLAIDTQGASPALSKALRQHLEGSIHPGWGRGAGVLGALRAVVGDRDEESVRRVFWDALVSELPEAASGSTDDLHEWIQGGVEKSGITLHEAELRTLLRLI